MNQGEESKLVRAIGRWSLTALVINSIIGSGVFGLPSVLARLVGAASPIAVVVAGVAVGIIVACFAEVASRFSATGGPYLYARAALGRFWGIETGWLFWLARLTAPAANANLFVVYLGEFWPRVTTGWPRFLVLTVLVWGLAWVNVRGVKAGAQTSNAFTIAKLVPLLVIIVAGSWYLFSSHQAAAPRMISTSMTTWLDAMLLLVFAYGGYETALTPMAEATNPRRDSAFAVFAAILCCMLIYALIQWVALGVVPELATSGRPLADVAHRVFGGWGAGLTTVAALIALYGYLSANMLGVPRITYAMAEAGDFPAVFAAVHERFRTPHVSICLFAFLTWGLALIGGFAWNVTLSSVARLFYYAAVCICLLVLRRRKAEPAAFTLPGGPVLAGVGVILCIVLITRVDRSGFLILLVTIALAALNWVWAHSRKAEG